MNIDEFDQVRYVGLPIPETGLTPGEVGYVLENYDDGKLEIEFSFPDGTTWLQCVLAKSDLTLADESTGTNDLPQLSREVIYPAIKQYELTGSCEVVHPTTGEVVEVHREGKELLISTQNLGTILSMIRPENPLR